MFWGCFSYEEKGPCHCWIPETAAEKKQAEKEIEELNEELEPLAREQWELSTAMARLGLRTKPGRKPEWKWNKKNGKLQRAQGSGIDWYRYQTKVLLPKLLPFAKGVHGYSTKYDRARRQSSSTRNTQFSSGYTISTASNGYSGAATPLI